MRKRREEGKEKRGERMRVTPFSSQGKSEMRGENEAKSAEKGEGRKEKPDERRGKETEKSRDARRHPRCICSRPSVKEAGADFQVMFEIFQILFCVCLFLRCCHALVSLICFVCVCF